jgi:hypothetical protein
MFKLTVSWPIGNGSTTSYGSFAEMLALGRSFSAAGQDFAWEIIDLSRNIKLVSKAAR